ncbi:nuclear transport factor 2 family protein [Aestuariibaculum sediminum]|uniref:Nuclear transport factor 2 family protein n=1 Tax=Aestuariibaculum sediminum TaxID=2770637 RepID=A0A8J6PZP0_9FLAO|nr:nuclear transport factor 2 family protein [Aestuariibaculum sediminum]MBD0831727.1 nuclear transport factor 2 family protein [Aestuariibaculum sediminum]
MARFIFYIIVFVTSVFYGQENDQIKAKQTVETFFEGFHKGDTTLMKSVMMDNIVLQTTYTNKDGKMMLVTDAPETLLEAVANRTEDQKWDERLLDFNIQVDGTMANVWTPYEFWFNDTFSHCGVNNFQLFNDNGKWKIIYLIDTRRRQGCKAG